MVTLGDYVSEFVYKTYIRPALERGEKAVSIDVNRLYEDLNGAYSLDFLRVLLGSAHFCDTCHLRPEPAGSAVTPITYTFRLDSGSTEVRDRPIVQEGA